MTKYRTSLIATAAAALTPLAAAASLAVATIAAAVATIAAPQAAHAAQPDESRFNPYFEKIEGHWAGQGSIQTLNANGTVTTTSYSADIDATHESDATWNAVNHVVDQFGVSAQNTLSYTVAGEQLLLGVNGSVAEPVKIVKTSPLSLGYEVDRTESLTGRQYQFIYYTELDAAGATMMGHNTVLSNGVTISTETFNLRRD